MLLSEMVQADLIKTNLDAKTQWEAIEELVDFLIGMHELRFTDRSAIAEALFARERAGSTGLGHGVAIPHAAVECVKETVAAVGISRGGVSFDSQDGKPARLVVLLVLPKDSFQKHVRTLSGIAHLVRSQDLRERICEAKDGAEAMSAILEMEAADVKSPG